MPSFPNNKEGKEGKDEMEFMQNVAFLIKESGMGYDEVMNLPHQIFLSLIKQFRILKLQETEGGIKYLDDCERYNTTEPEFDKIRNNEGYKAI